MGLEWYGNNKSKQNLKSMVVHLLGLMYLFTYISLQKLQHWEKIESALPWHSGVVKRTKPSSKQVCMNSEIASFRGRGLWFLDHQVTCSSSFEHWRELKQTWCFSPTLSFFCMTTFPSHNSTLCAVSRCWTIPRLKTLKHTQPATQVCWFKASADTKKQIIFVQVLFILWLCQSRAQQRHGIYMKGRVAFSVAVKYPAVVLFTPSPLSPRQLPGSRSRISM